MLTISVWPRRLKEFLLTHPLYKSPRERIPVHWHAGRRCRFKGLNLFNFTCPCRSEGISPRGRVAFDTKEKSPFSRGFPYWWWGKDSNLGRRKPADLQSALVDRLSIPPKQVGCSISKTSDIRQLQPAGNLGRRFISRTRSEQGSACHPSHLVALRTRRGAVQARQGAARPTPAC